MALSFEKQAKLFELLAQGKTQKEIAEIVGCSRNTVKKYADIFKKRVKERKAQGEEKLLSNITNSGTALDVISREGMIHNILDLAKNEKDLGEMGAHAGMVVGSIADDLRYIWDATKPPHIRFAKVMRGGLTASSILFAATETYRRLREEEELKKAVRLTIATKDELKTQILELLKARGEMDVSDIAKELNIDARRIISAINELKREGIIELS